MLILKINFKNKKYIYYFNTFPNKNYFEKQFIPQHPFNLLQFIYVLILQTLEETM
jgi:hypothetical protein